MGVRTGTFQHSATPFIMTELKLDPILAVHDLQASAEWYRSVFNCQSTGVHLINLVTDAGEVLLCLHPWGEHGHPSLQNPKQGSGNGLLLYFRTVNLEAIRKNVAAIKHPIDEDIHLNPHSGCREFSLRDLDGYFLTITEYHNY